MIRAIVLSLAAVAAAPALAQDFPSAFSVTGVAAGDVLNIRSEPSADADAVGQIGPFALNVEVLETSADGKWGKVGLPEGNGWVSMAVMSRIPPTDPSLVQRPLSCFGTEPFWSVSLKPGVAEYNSPDTGVIPMTVTHEAVARAGYFIALEEGPTLTRTMIVTRETCSDGMSDRVYGFATRLFLESPEGNAAYSGCCTLDHR